MSLLRSNAVVAGIAAAQSGLPAYIPSTAYQVRLLTGATYGPTNGTTTMRSVTPAAWGTDDDIMRPWSGGFKPNNGSKLWLNGGGHNDSANNGLYQFDFGSGARPVGWSMLRSSASAANAIAGSETYSDGLPAAIHSYDGLTECNGFLYRTAGIVWSNPVGDGSTWRFNTTNASITFAGKTTAALSWTRLATSSNQMTASQTVADPVSQKILGCDRQGGNFTYQFYNILTDTWSAVKTVPTQFTNDGVMAFRPTPGNPSTGTILETGGSNYNGNLSFSYDINWTTETLSGQTTRNLGSPLSGGGSPIFYDSVNDRFWAWPGTATISNIYEINPTTFAVTAHPLLGDGVTSGTLNSPITIPNTESSNYNGTFGRFVWMPQYSAIGSVNSRTGIPFVIRLL